MIVDGVGSVRRLFNGHWQGMPGTYWAWPIDGYWDLHHVEQGIEPDGSDVIAEGFNTLKEAREWARDLVALERWRWGQ